MLELINKFATNPTDPWLNFLMGREYHKLGHTASAFSHYLRCAERSEDINLVYECFLLGYFCFDTQTEKKFTAKHLLLQAIQICPKRPEGYFLLSRFYERKGEYYECYFISSLGLSICDFSIEPLTSVEYPGKYGLIFEKAVSAWHWDKPKESEELFIHLKNNFIMDELYIKTIDNNLQFIKQQK
jgi:hypothetical protein